MSSNNPHDRESDGGPAFPIQGRDRLVSDDWEGMSLRDYFAAQALQGMIAGSHGLDITTEQFANQVYRIADAMLKERGK